MDLTPKSRLLAIFVVFMITSVIGEPSFTVLPRAVSEGDSVRITFSVSQYTDVTVEIINTKDSSIVCELGSGLLGKNPPAPFQANSLSQTVIWDKKDNYGKPFTGSWDVRVSLAMFADLDRIYNNDTRNVLQSLAPKAMGVDSLGNLYVLAAEWFRGTGTKLVVFSRNGEYLRTLAPYPGNLPEERLKGFGRITQPDGKKTPVIYQGMDGVILPEFFNPIAHTMAVTSDGKIVISNSIASVQW
ncbi:MAG: hypothetical protein JNL74_05250, partial [Fibrobacteres bacterium]|nr:hypothetical protein [Fibrobacterota bacterium]